MARSRRQRILIVLGAVGAVLVAAIGALILYLTQSDLGRHAPLIERMVADATGYELTIGELHIDLDLRGASTLEARDVWLTNPGVEPDPRLASVDRFSLEIELWPLLENRVHVRDAEVTGGEVFVRGDPEHGVNWVPHRDTPRPPRSGPVRVPRIIVERFVLESVTTTVGLPGLSRPLVVDADRLVASTDSTDAVLLDLEGELNGEPLVIAGTVGPLAEMIVAGEIRPDLEIHLAGATGAIAGEIDDLAHLGGVNVDAHGEGPDIDSILSLFGLPGLGGGEFSATANLTAAPEGTRIDADAQLGQLTATVAGTLDSLDSPSFVDLDVTAAGSDLSAALTLAGIDGAPAEDFEATGRVRWSGFPVTIDDVDIRIGDNTLTVNGRMGAPPSFSGSEIEIGGGGPDVSALLSLADVRFPAMPYRIDGRVTRLNEGLTIERFEVALGADRLTAIGTIGEWPEMEGTDLEVSASGPSLVPYRDVTGLDLPAEPFEISAEVVPTSRGIRVATGRVRIGSTGGSLEGEIVTDDGLTGSRLRVDLSGDDLNELRWAHGLDELPAKGFQIAGTVELAPGRLRLHDVHGRVGDVDVEATGTVALTDGAVGSDLKLSISGPDASWPLELAGLGGIPAWPFEVAGRLGVTDPGLTFDGVVASLGDLSVRSSGLVAWRDDRVGSWFRADLAGPQLANLEPIVGVTGLPEVPFSLAGSVDARPEGYWLDDAVATIGPNRLAVGGLVVTAPELVGSDLELRLDGPDLGALGHLAAGLMDLPDLPPEPYTVVGSFTVTAASYEISELEATLGRATATISGRLGRAPGFVGTDLTIRSRGPNASLFSAVTGVSVPVAPFNIDGRVERMADGLRFDDLIVRLGDYSVELDGALGEPPRLVGSELDVVSHGPSLALLAQLTSAADLPDLGYSLTGHVVGSPRQFRIDDLRARLGNTDVRGSLSLALEGRPRLEVDLDSDVVDLAELSRDRSERAETTAAEPPSSGPTPPPDRVLSDEPFDLARLDRLDAAMTWRISTLRLLTTTFSDLDLMVSLDDGRLEAGPVDAVGEHGGRFTGRLLLAPEDDGHRIDLQLSARGVQADLTNRGRGSGREPTTTDLLIDLSSHGETPHEAASHANGDVIVSLAGGNVDSSIVDLIGADIIVSLLDALNPFTEATPETVALECAVFVVDVTDGLVLAEPMAVKTENVTVLGHGALNLDTEQLDFEWVTKPRKGFGVSAATITNPYVKLGGSLAEPRLEVKPAQAMFSTGIAVATAGLSLLGKGLYDRVTSEGKVCEKGLEEAQRRLRGEAPHRRFRLFD